MITPLVSFAETTTSPMGSLRREIPGWNGFGGVERAGRHDAAPREVFCRNACRHPPGLNDLGGEFLQLGRDGLAARRSRAAWQLNPLDSSVIHDRLVRTQPA